MIRAVLSLIFMATSVQASQNLPHDSLRPKHRPLVRALETRDLGALLERQISSNMDLKELCHEANKQGIPGSHFDSPKSAKIDGHYPIGASPILQAMGVEVLHQQK